jgi:hypothetical protein
VRAPHLALGLQVPVLPEGAADEKTVGVNGGGLGTGGVPDLLAFPLLNLMLARLKNSIKYRLGLNRPVLTPRSIDPSRRGRI